MKMEIVLKDGTKKTFYSVESFTVTEEQPTYKPLHEYEVANTPTEGKLFEVNPLRIDTNLFEKPRKDHWQEKVRQVINEAFVEVKKNPEKYSAPFYTLIPERRWNEYKTVTELLEYANNLGGYIVDWVEQCMEWAQRIFNGESWEAICDNPDTANWLRLVVWKNNYCRLIGDWGKGKNKYPPTSLGNGCEPNTRLNVAVPLVAFKKN